MVHFKYCYKILSITLYKKGKMSCCTYKVTHNHSVSN